MSILADSLNNEITRRFNNKGSKEEVTGETPCADNIWNCITYATQDFDSLSEFMYTFKLTLNTEQPPVYFDPTAQWAYIRLPKLKLRWKDNMRVSQVEMGKRMYNVINVTWRDNKMYLPVEDGTSCEITTRYILTPEQQVETVLLPYGTLDITKTDEDPQIKVSGHTLTCKYPLTHYSVCFNRQGIYVNRKYRDKTEYIAELPEPYVIIEPQSIRLTDHAGNVLLLF